MHHPPDISHHSVLHPLRAGSDFHIVGRKMLQQAFRLRRIDIDEQDLGMGRMHHRLPL